jgi:hypothetical protein
MEALESRIASSGRQLQSIRAEDLVRLAAERYADDSTDGVSSGTSKVLSAGPPPVLVEPDSATIRQALGPDGISKARETDDRARPEA